MELHEKTLLALLVLCVFCERKRKKNEMKQIQRDTIVSKPLVLVFTEDNA